MVATIRRTQHGALSTHSKGETRGECWHGGETFALVFCLFRLLFGTGCKCF
ncbi:unnamed protein product [Ectocarpus sp. CCAP 1310/34]|nr:unnamed protein product [Ectocarpus sp. CCAP 1310/34]